MAFKELSQGEIDNLLDAERVVRIGFEANGEHYLVPLGFVRYRDALYAMTTRGRKTRWPRRIPWRHFRSTRRREPVDAISPLLVARFPDMPEWMQAEYAEKQEQGDVVFVRVRPSRLAGRKSEPG